MSHSEMLAGLAALPFVGALILSLMGNDQPRRAAWTAGLITLLGCALLAMLAPQVFAGEVLRWSVEWLPALDLRLGFRMDGLAFMFALLVLGIGALVVLYAAYYLDPKDPPARFFSFLLLFMGAMLGVVLADNFHAQSCSSSLSSLRCCTRMVVHSEAFRKEKASTVISINSRQRFRRLLANDDDDNDDDDDDDMPIIDY